MLKILAAAALAIAFAASVSAAHAGVLMQDHSRPADCLLEVKGKAYINGPCTFNPLDTDGSFQITEAYHRENMAYFAYLNTDPNCSHNRIRLVERSARRQPRA